MTDRYTKIVLTVIAAALVGLIAQNAIRPLYAEANEVRRVMICDPAVKNRCATLQPYSKDGNTYFGLQVAVQNPWK